MASNENLGPVTACDRCESSRQRTGKTRLGMLLTGNGGPQPRKRIRYAQVICTGCSSVEWVIDGSEVVSEDN